MRHDTEGVRCSTDWYRLGTASCMASAGIHGLLN